MVVSESPDDNRPQSKVPDAWAALSNMTPNTKDKMKQLREANNRLQNSQLTKA